MSLEATEVMEEASYDLQIQPTLGKWPVKVIRAREISENILGQLSIILDLTIN